MINLLGVLVFSCIIGLLIYFYLTSTFAVWDKRGINGPKPRPLLESFHSFLIQRRSFIYEMDDMYREYKGKETFVGIFEMTTPKILVISPEIVRNVLIKKFNCFCDNEAYDFIDKERDPLFSRTPFLLKGDEWRTKRAEILPAFTTKRIKASYPIMKFVCDKMNKYVAENPNGVNAKELSGRFTAEVVSSCIYGIEAGAFTNDKCPIRSYGSRIMEFSYASIIYFIVIHIAPIVQKLWKISFVPKEVNNFFISLMNDAISIRLKTRSDSTDFLSYLLELKEKKNLSTIDMAAHTLTFFLDGYETSSIAITNCLYMLAKHKHVQDQLRKEISKSLCKDTGFLSYEILTGLPYLEQVLNETLRLFPVVAFISKQCVIPTTLENINARDFIILAKDLLQIPVYSIHRDEEYYPNPEKFDPERFSEENGGVKKYQDMGVFLPFSDGPRQCLGMKFGLTQVKAAIAGIILNWDISLNEKTNKDPKLDPKSHFCTIEGGVWLDFKPTALEGE